MFKQVCFFKKRADITMDEFIDYYENHHSKLYKKLGTPLLPRPQRYVRRYLTPVPNPVTGEVLHPGYDCIMELWWDSRADFEAAMKMVGSPERLAVTIEDEKNLFATHSYPVCFVDEREHESTISSK